MARSIPLAFEISTVRESDSSHGAKSSISSVQVREESEQAHIDEKITQQESNSCWANILRLAFASEGE